MLSRLMAIVLKTTGKVITKVALVLQLPAGAVTSASCLDLKVISEPPDKKLYH